MHSESFDQLVVVVGSGASRRRLVGGLVALAGSALVGDAALAKKGDGKPNNNNNGNGNGNGNGRGKGRQDDKAKRRGFNAQADGTVTAPSEAGCQFPGSPSGQVCTTGFAGAGAAAHLGAMTFTSTLTADWSGGESNGADGFCADLVEGSVAELVSDDKGALAFEIAGKVCQVGDSGSTDLELVGATYKITGGAGRYKDASGTGTLEGTVDGAGVATFELAGRIAF